ncbi:hypothetical protein GCM10028816_14670 [Spirosoma lituiforme]
MNKKIGTNTRFAPAVGAYFSHTTTLTVKPLNFNLLNGKVFIIKETINRTSTYIYFFSQVNQPTD